MLFSPLDPNNDAHMGVKDPLDLLTRLVEATSYTVLLQLLIARGIGRTVSQGLIAQIKNVVEPHKAAEKAETERWHEASKKVRAASKAAGTHRDVEGIIQFHDVAIDPAKVPTKRKQVRVGRRIRHIIFGDGTVVENPGPRPNPNDVAIQFDVHGLKVLLWGFCSSKLNLLPPLTRRQKAQLEAQRVREDLAALKKGEGRK